MFRRLEQDHHPKAKVLAVLGATGRRERWLSSRMISIRLSFSESATRARRLLQDGVLLERGVGIHDRLRVATVLMLLCKGASPPHGRSQRWRHA
jgi:hypothetical protein